MATCGSVVVYLVRPGSALCRIVTPPRASRPLMCSSLSLLPSHLPHVFIGASYLPLLSLSLSLYYPGSPPGGIIGVFVMAIVYVRAW